MTGAAPPSPRIDDSRRLLGPNLFHGEPGAVLDVVLDVAPALRSGGVPGAAHAAAASDAALADTETLLLAWATHVRALHAALGWPAPVLVVRRHARGASCFATAPIDQLLTATDVNEEAWRRAERELLVVSGTDARAVVQGADAHAGDVQVIGDHAIDDARALGALRSLRDREHAPRFVALLQGARSRGVSCRWDDTTLWLGAGHRGVRYVRHDDRGTDGLPLPRVERLPVAADVPWKTLGDVPTALVTGSNGKTTTVRMLAAILTAAGHVVGRSTTDAVQVGDTVLDTGDLSGPHGARLALGDPRTTAAVLETARGGILRRGLAMQRADVAVVTTLAADHLGGYGITTLDELAEAKLVVARALGSLGVLVVNAEVEALRRLAPARAQRLCWIARDPHEPALAAHVHDGGMAAAVLDGAIALHANGAWRPIIAVASVPATVGGAAWHNVLNALCAAAAAHVLGVGDATIARALGRFGADPRDNPGRLMRFERDGVQVIVDYAHNAQGVRALADVVQAMPAARRAIVLGTGGDRDDAALAAMAQEAARPPGFACYVAKETPQVARGRAPGEVSGVLVAALVAAGVPASAIVRATGDVDAARRLLAWARPGDLLALPVHAEREAVLALLGAAPPTR